MDEEMVRVSGISKAYGRKPVLRDVAFQAAKGQCVGIVGANGCGKSTLLAVLAGALKPDSGEVLYEGKLVWGKAPKAASRTAPSARPGLVGYVPQGNPLIEELSVKDNLKLWYQAGKKSFEKEQKEGLIRSMGLGEYLKTPAGKLSGGMKRRLSLACALMNRPKLLVLDEPGAALDVVYKEEIRRHLRSYLSQGGTVIMASHEEPELALCGRLLLMRGGTLREIDAGYSSEQLASLIKDGTAP